MPNNDYTHDISLGRRSGRKLWNKFGRNASLAEDTEEMIWEQGGYMTFLTTGSTLSLVSTSALDVSAGTGARTITIIGVDENRNYQEEVVTLNGITPVVTTTQWLGINRMNVASAGSVRSNVGDIIATSVTGTHVQASIPATHSSSQQMVFFTRSNWDTLSLSVFLNSAKVAGGQSPKVEFKAYFLNFTTNVLTEIFYAQIDTAADSMVHLGSVNDANLFDPSGVLYFTAKSDIGGTFVNGRFSMLEQIGL